MKIRALLFFIVFLTSLQAQTTYYFSTSGNDSNNGTSTSTPKATLAALQTLLASAQPGDQFLLKRGDTWTTRAGVYGLDFGVGVQGTSANPIIIGSYGTGERPKFDFAGSDYAIRIYSGSALIISYYVEIRDLYITSTFSIRPDNGIYMTGSGSPATSNHHITIDNCVIDGMADEGLFILRESYNITIQNCEIINNDGIGLFSGVDGFTVRNNYFYSNGDVIGFTHQLYTGDNTNVLIEGNTFDTGYSGIKLANGRNVIIRNNSLTDFDWSAITVGGRDVSGAPLGYLDSVVIEKNIVTNSSRSLNVQPQSGGTNSNITRLEIKNNIFINASVYALVLQGNNISNSSIVNNTIYNSLQGLYFSSGTFANLTVKNNILYNTLYSSGNLLYVGSSDDLNDINTDYNLYYSTVGSDTKVGSTTRTLLLFKVAFPLKELNGISTNPLFSDPLNFVFQLNENSIAIDNGANLSSVGVNDDFEGNQRPAQNGFDIGAYEYGSSSSGSNLKINSKILLEGPFDSTGMLTSLSGSGYIPLIQPYDSSPWNYSGSESVSSIPSGVVDWVLLELRTGTSASTSVARKAAFLKSDGTIVNLDGSTNPTFAIAEGNYYLVIMHRNHLSIMSANAISLNGNSSLYDFTTGPSKAFGTNPLTNLGNGKWGMYAGDGDLNSIINVIDYGSVGNNLFQTGYNSGDLDLNGIINVMDYAKTNLNLFKNSQVPN